MIIMIIIFLELCYAAFRRILAYSVEKEIRIIKIIHLDWKQKTKKTRECKHWKRERKKMPENESY